MTKKTSQPQLEQSELFKADIGWFHIFKELIRNGTWARLSLAGKALYPVIKAHANHKSGEAFPSIDTLEKYSGMAKQSVVKALKELEAEGLLVKSTSVGKHNNYSLVEKFEITDTQGRPTASISFDYMPALVGDAVAELRNFMAKGMTLPDGKTQFIKIDNLTLNITQNLYQPDSNPTNNTFVGGDQLAKMKEILKKGKQ